jgi:predicted nucleotidyltransferase
MVRFLKIRTRDFIYTTDDLLFASTNYIHPKDRFISFLRYVPDKNGDRAKNGKRFSKVTSEEAYHYIRKNHPEYLYFCEVNQVEMMGVPINKMKEVIKPEKRLSEIKKQEKEAPSKSLIIKKLLKLADFFHYKAGISYDNLGISGSILPNLQKTTVSDIDFVVYGLKNHKKAIATFKEFKDKEIKINNNEEKKEEKIILNSIQGIYWEQIYNKRMKDSSLTKKEFYWYENRKNNRGIIEGTLFDILATRNWDEIQGVWGDTKYQGLGTATIEATIEDAIASFDNPAIYKVKDLKILEIESVNINSITQIREIISFTHTYSGEAIEKERIIAKGKIEKVLKDNGKEIKKYYRLVIGTTRESIDEFIKLKNMPLEE